MKGARQVGKTESIRAFGKANYESVIEINFVLQKKFRAIFDDGYDVDSIVKNISLLAPDGTASTKRNANFTNSMPIECC